MRLPGKSELLSIDYRDCPSQRWDELRRFAHSLHRSLRDRPFVDRVINVLCGVRDRAGFVVIEAGAACKNVGGGVMKIDLHLSAFIPLFTSL
jgi:hypothetical protein